MPGPTRGAASTEDADGTTSVAGLSPRELASGPARLYGFSFVSTKGLRA